MDERVVISAKLVGLSAGREGAPVRGSGIFVSGAGFTGGGVTTHGEGMAPFELHGAVGTFRVGGGFTAAGGGFDKI